MTATQAPPVTTRADAPAGLVDEPVTGLARILGSADHKVVGRLYIGAALLLGLASAVAGLLAGIDRINGTYGDTLLDGETFPQVFAFHTTSATLLCVLPALVGLAMVVVPLQVGARSIAFPRAAAASFWAFLMGAGLSITALALNGGPGGGEPDAVDLWLVATGLVVGALVLASICVATTALALRTRGLDLDRVPFLTWSMLCTSVIWVLTLPVFAALLLIQYVDHSHGGIFIGADGPGLYDQLAWLNDQPQVYAFAVPVLGIALDTVLTASRVRLAPRTVARVAIAAFAVLGVGAFVVGATVPATQPVTKGMALLAPLPVLAVLGLVGLVLKQGRPRVTSGLVGGVLALLVLLLATLVGAATAFEGALELSGTQWTSAQTHLTLAAAVIALVAGLYHWSTKVIGRVAGEAMGRTAPLLMALGALVVAVPEAISGLTGDGAEARSGIEALNAIAVGGAGLVLLGGVVAVLGLVGRRRDDEPADPWTGQTLEWSTASPPVFDNFDRDLPTVTSAEPLLVDDATEEAPVR